MMFPTKFDELDSNPLVLGASILELIKAQERNLEEIFQKLKRKHEVTLDRYLDTVLFLWLSGLIEIQHYYLRLNKAA